MIRFARRRSNRLHQRKQVSGRSVTLIVREQGPRDAGVLIGERHCGLVPGFRRLQRLGPGALVIAAPSREHQLAAGAVHEQGSQIRIPALGDAAQALDAAGGMLAGHEPEPGGELPAIAEVVPAADCCDDGRSGDGAYAVDLGQPLGALILANESIDLPVVGQHLLMKPGELCVEGIERFPGEGRQVLMVPLPDRRPAVFEGIGAFGDDDAELGPRSRLTRRVCSATQAWRSRCTRRIAC